MTGQIAALAKDGSGGRIQTLGNGDFRFTADGLRVDVGELRKGMRVSFRNASTNNNGKRYADQIQPAPEQ